MIQKDNRGQDHLECILSQDPAPPIAFRQMRSLFATVRSSEFIRPRRISCSPEFASPINAAAMPSALLC
jgi:hypothetical protein